MQGPPAKAGTEFKNPSQVTATGFFVLESAE